MALLLPGMRGIQAIKAPVREVLPDTYSMYLDGVNDNWTTSAAKSDFNMGNDGGGGDVKFSIGGWVYFDDETETYGDLWSASNGVTDTAFWFNFHTTAGFRLGLANSNAGNTSGRAYYTDGNSLSRNTWYHYLVTYDGEGDGGVDVSQVKIYQNGVSQTVSLSPGNSGYTGMQNKNMRFNMTGPWFIGAEFKFGDTYIWRNRVLSAAEIAVIYGAGAGDGMMDVTKNYGSYQSAVDLVAFFRSEEGSGTTITDSSGNGNGLTSQSGATFTTDVPS